MIFPPFPKVSAPQAPWSPLSITNAHLLFMADTGVTETSGKVSAWSNLGTRGSSQNLAQGTAGLRPTRVATDSGANNQPTVRFTASSTTYMSGTGYTTSGAYELYIVFRKVADPPAAGASSGLVLFGGPASAAVINYTDRKITDGNLRTSAFVSVVPTPLLTSMRLYTVKSGGGTWKNYLDGTLLSSTTSAFGFPNSSQSFHVGTGFVGAYYMDGWIGQIIGVDGAMSASDYNNYKTYLNAKYGMSVV